MNNNYHLEWILLAINILCTVLLGRNIVESSWLDKYTEDRTLFAESCLLEWAVEEQKGSETSSSVNNVHSGLFASLPRSDSFFGFQVKLEFVEGILELFRISQRLKSIRTFKEKSYKHQKHAWCNCESFCENLPTGYVARYCGSSRDLETCLKRRKGDRNRNFLHADQMKNYWEVCAIHLMKRDGCSILSIVRSYSF